MTEGRLVYHLALRDLHAAAGARFEEHDGWSVPARYIEVEREYEAIRNAAAIVDRSPRSRLLVAGTDALDVLRAVFAGHVDELEEGRAMRTVILDERNEIRDLVLIARTGGIAYTVVGEPAQRTETLGRLRDAVREGWDVHIDDRTETTCLIGLTGPGAGSIARDHLSDGLPARIQLMHAVVFEFHGFRTLAMRTSDTGEDGFEFMVAPAVAQHMIETLRTAGVALAGFDAQEVARIEACVPAWTDLSPGLSPAEADLDVLLGIEGGREGRILAAVLVEGDAIPAQGTPVLGDDGLPRGELRSATFSPGLRSIAGLAILDVRAAVPGAPLTIAGARAHIAAKPLLRRRPTS